MENKEVDAKELFSKTGGDADSGSPSEAPTEGEMREAMSPDTSQDGFTIGGKQFLYRISSIRTQKIMAISLDSITDLLTKIDVAPILKNIQERLQRPRKKMLEQIEAMEAEAKKAGKKPKKGAVEKIIRETVGNSEDDNFMDLIDVFKDVLKYGGLSNIVITVLDLYVGIVFAVCNAQNNDITREWIEDNLNFAEAQEIFFTQMQKDHIGGKVIDFLSFATRQVVNQ